MAVESELRFAAYVEALSVQGDRVKQGGDKSV